MSVEYVEDKTGVMVSIAPNGKLVITKWQLPINKNEILIGWMEDFFHAIEEHSKFRLFILRLVLGRYAYREMVGALEYLKLIGWWLPNCGYSLQNVDYNTDGAKLKFEYDDEA